MPAATDTILTVEQQLWALVMAWPGITSNVRAKNIVRFDNQKVPWPDVKTDLGMGKQAADVPEIKLEIISGQPDPKAPRTFCLQPQVRNVVYEWTVLGPDRSYPVITQVFAELRACMVASGTQLGIPTFVAKWEEEFRIQDAPPANDGGAKRRELHYRMKVNVKG